MTLQQIWDPALEVGRLQDEMNRLFLGATGAIHEYPPVNLFSNADGVLVTTELPGVKPEELDISVNGDLLTLKGARVEEKIGEQDVWHRRERFSGKFTRTVQLPFRVDPNAVAATFSKGVLSISLPRAEEDKPKKISIKAA